MHADVFRSAEVCNDFAANAKTGVKASICVVPNKAKVKIATDGCVSGDQYLAVPLHDEAVTEVRPSEKVGSNFAGGAEGSIQIPGRVVAHQGEIVASAHVLPRHQDFAVSLHGYAVACIPSAKIRGELAVSAETRIQSAVGVVTHQREVVVGTDGAPPGNQDLAIGL